MWRHRRRALSGRPSRPPQRRNKGAHQREHDKRRELPDKQDQAAWLGLCQQPDQSGAVVRGDGDRPERKSHDTQKLAPSVKPTTKPSLSASASTGGKNAAGPAADSASEKLPAAEKPMNVAKCPEQRHEPDSAEEERGPHEPDEF